MQTMRAVIWVGATVGLFSTILLGSCSSSGHDYLCRRFVRRSRRRRRSREPPAQAVAKPVSTAVTTSPSCDVGVFDDVPDNLQHPLYRHREQLARGARHCYGNALRALRTGSEWNRDTQWIFGSAWEFETWSLRIRRSAS